jgi:hypothetical protein
MAGLKRLAPFNYARSRRDRQTPGIRSPYCGRAASGHAAAPPSSVMNSRRLIRVLTVSLRLFGAMTLRSRSCGVLSFGKVLACRFQRCFEAGHLVVLAQRLVGEIIKPLARLGIASGVRSEGGSIAFGRDFCASLFDAGELCVQIRDRALALFNRIHDYLSPLVKNTSETALALEFRESPRRPSTACPWPACVCVSLPRWRSGRIQPTATPRF